MFYYSDEFIDRMLTDDAPLGDLTCRSLEIGFKKGRMTYAPHENGRLCGLNLARKILQKLELETSGGFNDGDDAQAGQTVLEARGSAAALHLGWKVTQNIMEWASGVCTYTATMLAAGRSANPDLHLACTRKSIPGTKPLAQAAVIHGGGIMHRAGLSETILLFAYHRAFTEKPEDFSAHVQKLRHAAPEKKIIVEVDDMTEAHEVLSGPSEGLPDVLQLDKFSLEDTAALVKLCREKSPQMMISSAGGVNLKNIADYAATGIDLVVSSAPYYAKPLDMKVALAPLK